MDEICKSLKCVKVKISLVDDSGNESDTDGYLMQIFVPLDKRAEIDRNDENRRALTEILDAAITLVEG
jgi:hypothetical protein|tara:strand:- start:203 stop:406 length:204 start_codon:yes stop_codon:yes gene_type:complete